MGLAPFMVHTLELVGVLAGLIMEPVSPESSRSSTRQILQPLCILVPMVQDRLWTFLIMEQTLPVDLEHLIQTIQQMHFTQALMEQVRQENSRLQMLIILRP